MLRALQILILFAKLLFSSGYRCPTYSYLQSEESANCTGDACVTYITDGRVVLMGCATNVLFSSRSGCYGDGSPLVTSVICACQADMCNNYSLDGGVVVEEQPKTACFTSSPSQCTGFSCRIDRSNNEDENACGIPHPSLSFVELQANMIVLEQTSKDDLVNGQLFFYLAQDFHASCFNKNCEKRAIKLRKDGIKSNRPQVQCHTYLLENRHNITCRGDFCFYRYDNGAIIRGCYTIYDALAERKITARKHFC